MRFVEIVKGGPMHLGQEGYGDLPRRLQHDLRPVFAAGRATR